MTKLIERNTTIPTKRTEVFTTADDMQPSVEIHVTRASARWRSYNKTLGKFQLGRPAARPARRAADRGHLRHRRQRHRARHRQGPRKEAIEARNQLDSLLYGTRKLVKENEAKLSDAEKLMAEEEFKKADQVLEDNREPTQPEALRAAFESLQAVAHKIAESMYKQAGGPAGGEAGPDAGAAPGGGDDVIDADFTDKT
jgi:molecular chaperone DnaK